MDNTNLFYEVSDILVDPNGKSREEIEQILRKFCDAYSEKVQWAINLMAHAINTTDKAGAALFFYEAASLIKDTIGKSLSKKEKAIAEVFHSNAKVNAHGFMAGDNFDELSDKEVKELKDRIEIDKDLQDKLLDMVDRGILSSIDTEYEVKRPEKCRRSNDPEKTRADSRNSILLSMIALIDEYINKINGLLPDDPALRGEHVLAHACAADFARIINAAESRELLVTSTKLENLYIDMAADDNPLIKAMESGNVKQDIEKAQAVMDEISE